MNVAIYIYNNAEVLDFSGPYEVFSTANRFSKEQADFNVFLVAETKDAVIARAGYSVNPHFDFCDHPPIDILIVVGGVHNKEVKNTRLLNWIKDIEPAAMHVVSVCTGAFILAEAGFLNHRKVTTHWEDMSDLQKDYPLLHVQDNFRWIEDGKFITSGGISAGIDMSLHLVSRLTSLQQAENTARQMEYTWHRNQE